MNLAYFLTEKFSQIFRAQRCISLFPLLLSVLVLHLFARAPYYRDCTGLSRVIDQLNKRQVNVR